MVQAIEGGCNTYRKLSKLPIYQSKFQIDGDRRELQKVGIIDVTGRDFHTIVLERKITREELDRLFPIVKGGGIVEQEKKL